MTDIDEQIEQTPIADPSLTDEIRKLDVPRAGFECCARCKKRQVAEDRAAFAQVEKFMDTMMTKVGNC